MLPRLTQRLIKYPRRFCQFCQIGNKTQTWRRLLQLKENMFIRILPIKIPFWSSPKTACISQSSLENKLEMYDSLKLIEKLYCLLKILNVDFYNLKKFQIWIIIIYDVLWTPLIIITKMMSSITPSKFINFKSYRIHSALDEMQNLLKWELWHQWKQMMIKTTFVIPLTPAGTCPGKYLLSLLFLIMSSGKSYLTS